MTRTAGVVTAEDAIAMLEPGDVLVDCTGSKSVLRDRLVPSADETSTNANTHTIRLEHALVITFLYGRSYECNEYCKYYKNAGNDRYKFIPSVHRTYTDGNITHVTGIVTITADEYEAMPGMFDGGWLRDNFPVVAESMDRFIDKIKEESHGELIGELAIIRIPLNLYRARNATSRPWHTTGPFHHPFASTPVFLLGRFGDRLAVLPVDLTGLRVRALPRPAHRGARPLVEGLARSLRSIRVQAVVTGLHAQQDDQAQQGPARMRRRHRRAARQAAPVLGANRSTALTKEVHASRAPTLVSRCPRR